MYAYNRSGTSPSSIGARCFVLKMRWKYKEPNDWGMASTPVCAKEYGPLSPNGAAVNSQGVQPLGDGSPPGRRQPTESVHHLIINIGPNGAAVNSQGVHPLDDGFTPWETVHPLVGVNGPNPSTFSSSTSAPTGPRSIARGFTPWTSVSTWSSLNTSNTSPPMTSLGRSNDALPKQSKKNRDPDLVLSSQ